MGLIMLFALLHFRAKLDIDVCNPVGHTHLIERRLQKVLFCTVPTHFYFE